LKAFFIDCGAVFAFLIMIEDQASPTQLPDDANDPVRFNKRCDLRTVSWLHKHNIWWEILESRV